MASAKVSLLQRQITRVRRRLILQTLLNSLAWCWAAAILLSAGWFLLEPALLDGPPRWLRWTVAGGLVGGATVLGVVLGLIRGPSQLIAALSLDSAFGLKERVTTSLTLAPEQKTTSAGQALLADVDQHIRDLDVGSRFPVRLTWTAALVPACAACLALVAMFYQPIRSQARTGIRNEGSQPAANAAEIDRKMQELKKTIAEKKPAEQPKSEEMERLLGELDKMASKPRDTKDQIRERVKEMTALEEQMKAREKEMAEKARSLKEQLRRLDLSTQKDGEGPAKDLQNALAKGDLNRAKDEIERLKERLQKHELTEKEKEQLKRQLQDMKEKLQRLAEAKEKEQQLKAANLDPKTLQKEMQKEKQRLGDLNKLAEQMGKCEKSLKEGDMEAASQSLSEMAKKLDGMDLENQELQDLRLSLSKLEDAKDASLEAMQEGEPMDQDLEQDQDNGGQGSGRRPLGKQKPFRSFEAKAKVEFDAKGKKIFDGYAPGQNFKKKSEAEFFGEIKQASQEAPEAIEQQRVPKAAREMMKGYFQRLGAQAEKEQKTQPKP
ncbi:MAG TPA: hypothetical protein VKU02_15230 [Gemmataceae bacterium]|nr:hypothetical protein [Gemmataceae bacterium]